MRFSLKDHLSFIEYRLLPFGDFTVKPKLSEFRAVSVTTFLRCYPSGRQRRSFNGTTILILSCDVAL